MIHELNVEIDRLTGKRVWSQFVEKYSEAVRQSFPNSPQKLITVENQKFKLHEQVEQITQAKSEQKNLREQQLLKERIRTLEAQLQTVKMENATTL